VAFPDSFMDQLISASDIYTIVSRYVQLKKSGSNYFGLCPFHKEKTGSFSVNTDKQIYHCFGCGAGGGVINFIMQIERLEYRDAVEFLARLAGIPMPEDRDDQEYRKKRMRMLSLNKEAARFFYSNLSKPVGSVAVDYLKKRALSPGTVNHFGLGYAPDSWDTLIRAMAEKGYTKEELLSAGLAAKSQKGTIFDMYRNRVMFPIIDIRGDVIAFGGRVLDNSVPKYINTKDTLVFNKNRNLFALNYAKREEKRVLILAEGYMDVIALHQAGFKNAVASLGTALTNEQARLMKKYADTVIIAYDADNAGQAATNRAIEILKSVDMEIKILRIPDAKDPDEFIKANGSGAFESLLNQSIDQLDYKMQGIKSGFDMTKDDEKIGFVKKSVPMLAAIDSPVEREIYARRVAETAGVSPQSILSEVNRMLNSQIKKEKRDKVRQSMSPSLTVKPQAASIRYDNIRSARAEEGIISLLLSDVTLLSDIERFGLSPDEFTSDYLKKLFVLLADRHKDGRSTDIASMGAVLNEDEMRQLTTIVTIPVPGDRSKAIADYINSIRDEKAKLAVTTGTDENADLLAFQARQREKKGYGGTQG